MDFEKLTQKILEQLLSQEAEEASLAALPRPLIEEAASLSERECEDLLVLVEAELILKGRKLKDSEVLSAIRKALWVRASRPVPLKEVFGEAEGDFLIPAGYVVTRGGIAAAEGLVSASPFYVAGKVVDREAGLAEYRTAALVDGTWTELRSPCARGTAGVTRAVAAAGIFLNFNRAEKYAEDWLAQNFARLKAEDASLEAADAYEWLLEFAAENLPRFLGEEWGRFLSFGDAPEKAYLAVPVGRFEGFLKRIGRANARGSILQSWRRQGLLRPEEGTGRPTRPVRINGTVLRCVVVEVPPELRLKGGRQNVTIQRLRANP